MEINFFLSQIFVEIFFRRFLNIRGIFFLIFLSIFFLGILFWGKLEENMVLGKIFGEYFFKENFKMKIYFSQIFFPLLLMNILKEIYLRDFFLILFLGIFLFEGNKFWEFFFWRKFLKEFFWWILVFVGHIFEGNIFRNFFSGEITQKCSEKSVNKIACFDWKLLPIFSKHSYKCQFSLLTLP